MMSEAVKLGQKLPWNYKRIGLALFIFAIGCSKYLISNYYHPYIFKPLSIMGRFITGKIPFAIGEWVYIAIIILLIINVLNKILRAHHSVKSVNFWKLMGVQLINGVLLLYILFELCWGLNYQKSSPAEDFKINPPTTYSEYQMDSLSLELIEEMNHTRSKIADSSINALQLDNLFKLSQDQYIQIANKYPFLTYHMPSLKVANFPSWGDYMGFTAFYQPLTGEAIIRGDLPKLTLPFTICHEIGHQLGYASETEANFIAYVIGVASNNPLFQYSTQLQVFSYAQQAQLISIAKRGDSLHFKQIIARNKQMLSPKVLADRKLIRDFFTSKKDLQIPGSTQLYNQFLRFNQQAKGVESYNDVLLWALAYPHKKSP